MKIIRATAPEAVDYLKDRYLTDGSYKVEDVLKDLQQMLVETPDAILLLLLADGSDVKGHVVVLAPVGRNFTFMLQAHIDNDVPEVERKKLFTRAVMWTVALERSSIRTESARDPESFKRRWGFEVKSYVMEYEIPEDFYDEILFSKLKGQDNGQQQSTDNIDTVGASEESSEKTQ